MRSRSSPARGFDGLLPGRRQQPAPRVRAYVRLAAQAGRGRDSELAARQLVRLDRRDPALGAFAAGDRAGGLGDRRGAFRGRIGQVPLMDVLPFSASETTAASASTNTGRALKDSVRLMRMPLSRAKAWASTSRSYRISRWSATKPIGQTSTSLAAESAMASSRSGPSQGSPVWLADWKANSHGGRSIPEATSRQLSSSC